MGDPGPIIELSHVSFTYGDNPAILKDVHFSLREGQKVGLIGHNGSGKTTLLHLMMGLVKPSAGTLQIFGRPMKTEKDFLEIRRKIGFVFQNADDQLFSPTVIEDVAFGLLNMEVRPAQARDRALQTLERLNLAGFEDRLTHQLSGGEKKLVALATVLVMDPRVLLMDEPSTGLDLDTCQRIIEILGTLDITCLIVSHEYDFLARTTRDIYSMKGGQVLYNGASDSLHSHVHAHPYGQVIHHHEQKEARL